MSYEFMVTLCALRICSFFFSMLACVGLFVLTLIVILGGDGEYGVLNIFIFVDLRLVQGLVEVRWIVILVGNSDTDEFSNCVRERREREKKMKLVDCCLLEFFIEPKLGSNVFPSVHWRC